MVPQSIPHAHAPLTRPFAPPSLCALPPQERPAGDSSPERRLHSSPMAKDTQGWVGRTGNNLDLSDIQGAQSSHWHNKAAFPSRPRPTMDVSDIVVRGTAWWWWLGGG